MKMYPHAESRANFKYPRGGLMQLRDFIKDGELGRSTMLDANGEHYLIVVKNVARPASNRFFMNTRLTPFT